MKYRQAAQNITGVFQTLLGFGFVLAIGDSYAQTASSDSKLEEIVVTAERRSEDIQRTATSVSVRNGKDLLNEGKYSLKNILEDIPGIEGGAADSLGGSASSGTDATAAGLTIRGIQSNAGTGGSITSVATAAAIYVDGVYEGVGGGYDIDRVEVLRGPQGTLYGRSATSGLVAIHTRNPDLSKIGVDATLEAGNYSLLHYTGVLNAPLVTDVLAVRVAANRYERDGYDSKEGGTLSTTDAKAKLLYRPSESLSILLGFALQDNKTHTGGVTTTLSTPNDYVYTNTPVGPGENKYRQYWAEMNWDMGFATLTYMPALRTWTSEAMNYIRNPAINADQTLRTPKDDFWTHELRLASNSDSRLTWQVGTLYYDNKLENHNTVYLQPSGALGFNADTDRKTTATGAFAESTFRLTETWRLTGGLRYDYTKVKVAEDYSTQQPPAFVTVTRSLTEEEGTQKFNNVTYKARVEHDLTPQNLVYASISSGFSPGDVTVTTGPSGDPEVVLLKDQTLTAYEIGTKNRFLDESLQVNGGVYYYDYGGYQTAAINIGNNPANPTFAVLSTPVQVYGAELELLYQLTAHDRLGFNLSYTNAYYVDKTSVPVGNGKTFADYFARDKVVSVVPVTAVLSYEHVFELPGSSNLSIRGDARYLSAHDEGRITPDELQAGLLPYVRTDAQVIGNLSITWSSGGHYSVTGYVRNVGDNRYKTNVMANLNGSTVTPYDPRTYGAALNVSF